MEKYIEIKGAKENNLKNIDLKVPKDKLTVMTGLSGSGKTSLAFDTIYAEGQRRYVESLSTYARQFLGNVDKPNVDSIEGLSPAISIDQKTTSKNPRSTVGTVTEIYDYLRLLYARIGKAYCPTHGVEIHAQTITEMVNKAFEFSEGSKIIIYSPIVFGKKGGQEKVIEIIKKNGFSKIRVDGNIMDVTEEINLDKNIKHNIDIICDRLKVKEENRSRLYSSLEVALKFGEGKVIIDIEGNESIFSEHYACPYCDFSIAHMEPRLFSFNSPFGACPTCNGLGVLKQIDYDKLVPDDELSINQFALKYFKNFQGTDNIEWQTFDVLLNHYHINRDIPFKDLSDFDKDVIFHGSKEPITYEITTTGFNTYRKTKFIEGVADLVLRRYQETTSNMARDYYGTYLKDDVCTACNGRRLSREALAVKVGGLNISEFTDMTVFDARNFIKNLDLSEREHHIGDLILKETSSRLDFLINVGLDYLTLSRSAGTLSGGEAQRIRLATQIGSHLTGVLYVLDEPSIGLHQSDNDKLINTLKEMRDLGNTLIVVEHDEEIMRQADYLVDIGPGAGIHGGEVVACGTPEEVMANTNSITGDYLSGRKKIAIRDKRRTSNGRDITLIGCEENNLKNIDVTFLGGCLNLITGVSGSGKSTLMNDILYNFLSNKLNRAKTSWGKVKDIIGYKSYDRVIDIDQSPIGRMPRSNPATYTGVFDNIRDLFASTVEAKVRGYNKGRFSFNVKGGRCERCWGDGVIKIEMHFLPDVYVPCEECGGKRYNSETLEVKYKGKTIADVLDMTVDEACELFQNIPNIYSKLKTLYDVGLGYIKLGQPSTTLSGGEAQRVKLATELSKRISDRTIYLLDEPTTGLHSDDVKRLLDIINYIVDSGATVIIIEHNLDVIKSADHIIDLGPQGGNRGGEVVGTGTPEELSKNELSLTGKYLKKVLE